MKEHERLAKWKIAVQKKWPLARFRRWGAIKGNWTACIGPDFLPSKDTVGVRTIEGYEWVGKRPLSVDEICSHLLMKQPIYPMLQDEIEKALIRIVVLNRLERIVGTRIHKSLMKDPVVRTLKYNESVRFKVMRGPDRNKLVHLTIGSMYWVWDAKTGEHRVQGVEE